MLAELVQLFVAPMLLFATAASPPAGGVGVPIPAGADFTQVVSGHLLAQAFGPDTDRAELNLEGKPHVEALIIQTKACVEAGYHVTYRIVVRNRGMVPATNISIENRYPGGTEFVRGTRPPDVVDPTQNLIIWYEPFLAPSEFLSYTFTVKVVAPGRLVDEVQVVYQGVGGPDDQEPKRVLTDHIIHGSCSNPPAGVGTDEEPFSLVVLPDTQKYTRFNPQIFTAQTKWIAENAEKENIAFVTHVGDLVDKNTRAEWERARDAMSVLDDVVPYQVVPGNHDMGSENFETSADKRDTSLYNEYFPDSKFRTKLHFGATRVIGTMDNSYQYFRGGGLDWLVLALEFGPRQEVIDWANRVLTDHPNHRVIIVTHSYLRPTDDLDEGNIASYGVGDDGDGPHDGLGIWTELASQHKNVVMVLSGHEKGDGAGRRVGEGIHGNKVYEMMSNYQHFENGGNGFLRLIRVDASAGKIEVKTFSPSLGTFKKDDDNEFSFDEVDFNIPDPAFALPAGGLPPLTPRTPGKFGATICDPAERGCVPFLPGLGINFQLAQSPTQQVRVCSKYQGTACIPQRPNLGVRFAEAIADILPGDCRVLEDDVIQTPAYYDALQRRGASAAYFNRSLETSDKDFTRLLHENSLRGTLHTTLARHQLVTQAPANRRAGGGQDGLAQDYVKIQAARLKAFEGIARDAVFSAEQAIGRACGLAHAGKAGQEMEQKIVPVRAAFAGLLARRRAAYANMQQVYAASRDFEATYVAHQKEDERQAAALKPLWEVALSDIKTQTLECAKESFFAADVETSWCESNGYAGYVVRGAPEPEKARRGEVGAPDTSDIVSRTSIDAGAVKGKVCGGAPGDPWWADDCSCQCNDQIPVGGGFKSCQELNPITRHDITITSPEECLLEEVKHADPFF